jgi:DNA primase
LRRGGRACILPPSFFYFLTHNMPRIPEETIQQVLAATDIVEVVGRYVKLRRAGGNFVGLCPFHNEKSPSFNVSPSRSSYHCFGCGAGGTAIRFLMEHDGMTFVESVKRLADAAGIRIEEEVWDANAEKAAKLRSALIRLHQAAAVWYHQLLMKSPLGEPGRAYLKSRGITSAVAKNWQIGYAPGSPQLLRQWAGENRFSQALLLESGILTENERGAYPRFRDRLMFPIRNDNGEVIAFSGRLLQADAKAAKYLNSPETPIFSKSKILFGFDKSRRAISKAGQVIVCEGQIDVIMVYEAGLENVVASQGTAFTEHHGRLLKRHADEVVLCFDSDAAGLKAAERTFQILAPTGLNIKMVALPQGEDPDSLIRKEGADAFARRIGAAVEFLDYQMDHAMANPAMEQMGERVRFAEKVAANIRLLESPMARETAMQRVALRLGLADAAIRRQVGAGTQVKEKPSAPGAVGDRPGRNLLGSQDKTALLLCRMALNKPDVLKWLRTVDRPDLLSGLPGTELLGLVWQGRFDPLDATSMSSFLATLDRDAESALTQVLAGAEPKGGLEDAQQALASLELLRMQTEIQQLQTQLKTHGLTADRAMEMQRRVISLQKEYLDRIRPEPDSA